MVRVALVVEALEELVLVLTALMVLVAEAVVGLQTEMLLVKVATAVLAL
jgi:hypothetical protein